MYSGKSLGSSAPRGRWSAWDLGNRGGRCIQGNPRDPLLQEAAGVHGIWGNRGGRCILGNPWDPLLQEAAGVHGIWGTVEADVFWEILGILCSKRPLEC